MGFTADEWDDIQELIELILSQRSQLRAYRSANQSTDDVKVALDNDIAIWKEGKAVEVPKI